MAEPRDAPPDHRQPRSGGPVLPLPAGGRSRRPRRLVQSGQRAVRQRIGRSRRRSVSPRPAARPPPQCIMAQPGRGAARAGTERRSNGRAAPGGGIPSRQPVQLSSHRPDPVRFRRSRRVAGSADPAGASGASRGGRQPDAAAGDSSPRCRPDRSGDPADEAGGRTPALGRRFAALPRHAAFGAARHHDGGGHLPDRAVPWPCRSLRAELLRRASERHRRTAGRGEAARPRAAASARQRGDSQQPAADPAIRSGAPATARPSGPWRRRRPIQTRSGSCESAMSPPTLDIIPSGSS